MDGDDIDPNEIEDEEPLPPGVEKEVLKDGEGYKRPYSGDEVTLHYVGTLAADGTEFDSSRSRDKPFVFTIGQGHVIKGWDVGVATMRKGELAKFTFAPEYAYGEMGSRPKIPANATLIFEVELLSWVPKDDLFQDGGVIKTELREGDGWRSPTDGDEVRLSLRCVARDGKVVEDKPDLEYMIGSGACGALSKVVDKALCEMKKGEEAELDCKSEYAFGEKMPDGVIIRLTLHETYETKDVSHLKDRTLIKKRIVDGEGFDTPKEAYKVKMRVEEAVAGSLPGFVAKTLEFTVGNGEVCDALELVVLDMKEGDKAVLTCLTPQLCCDEQLGLTSISAEEVVLTVELLELKKGIDTWKMSVEEKIQFGTARKDMGSNLFRKGRYMLALGRYEKVLQLFHGTKNWEEQADKDQAAVIKKACELNCANCQLKLKDYGEAKKHCDAVLKEEAHNEKALFRRAQANLELKNFTDSMSDLKKLVSVDPQNKEARALYKKVQAAQKEEDHKSKGMFANMCKALGKDTSPQNSPEDSCNTAGRLVELTDPETYSALVYTPSVKAAEDDGMTPLLLYLHGAGESGSNVRDLISEGATGTPPVALETGAALPILRERFTMVAPQTAPRRGWPAEDISRFLDFLLSERSGLKLDPKRLYVTGHSMGGYGALVAGTTKRFAAVVPVATAGKVEAEDLSGVPVWAFHGLNDVVIPSKYSEEMVTSMRNAGATEETAQLTLYDEAPAPPGWPDYFGHASTIPAYATADLYSWLLSKSL